MSDKATHTPGPWLAAEDEVGTNPDICIEAIGYGIIADVGGGLPHVRRANARLIAAAPDLLAACEAALHDSEYMEPGKVYHGPGHELTRETKAMLRAAIARAKS